MIKTVLLFAGLPVVMSVHAAVSPIDIAQQTCLNNAFTTLAMEQCYTTASQAWDQEMTQHYHRLTATRNREQKTTLRTAQRAWLKYRDSWIEAAKARVSEGGTMALLQLGALQVELNKNQALALKSLAQSCGNPDECQ